MGGRLGPSVQMMYVQADPEHSEAGASLDLPAVLQAAIDIEARGPRRPRRPRLHRPPAPPSLPRPRHRALQVTGEVKYSAHQLSLAEPEKSATRFAMARLRSKQQLGPARPLSR